MKIITKNKSQKKEKDKNIGFECKYFHRQRIILSSDALCSVEIKSNLPPLNEIKPGYILHKTRKTWELFFLSDQKNSITFPVNIIPGLHTLNDMPTKAENLSEDEKKGLIKNITTFSTNMRKNTQEKINEIKKKYDFRADYDLLNQIDWYIADDIYYYSLDKKNLQLTDVRTSALDFKKAIEELNNSCGLILEMSRHSEKIKILLNKLIDADSLKENTQAIDYLENKLKDDPSNMYFKKQLITYREKNKEYSNNALNEMIENLEKFYEPNQHKLTYISKILDDYIETLKTKGRPTGSLAKELIFNLIGIYENGTGKRPTCGWNDYIHKYTGNFYKFLLHINEFLKNSNVPISLGTPEGIGQYTKKFLLPAYRKFKNSTNT